MTNYDEPPEAETARPTPASGRPERDMSAPASTLQKTLALLDAFSDERLFWTVDALADHFGYAQPTTYRYVRDLLAAGLLVRHGDGIYSIGPRIVELDHLIRRADPFLVAGGPVARDISEATGTDIALAEIFGMRIVTVHQHGGGESLALTFGRGRRLPLLRGAGSRAIVAHLPPARLDRVFAENRSDAERYCASNDRAAFRAAMNAIRKAGYEISFGELDTGLTGVAVPVFSPDGRILGSVIAALTERRFRLTRTDRLVEELHAGAARISDVMARSGWPLAGPGEDADD